MKLSRSAQYNDTPNANTRFSSEAFAKQFLYIDFIIHLTNNISYNFKTNFGKNTQQNSQLPHTINIVKKGIAEEVTFNAAMVNGACGTANGKSYSTTPVDNPPDNQLCLTGDASSVTANNPILKS